MYIYTYTLNCMSGYEQDVGAADGVHRGYPRLPLQMMSLFKFTCLCSNYVCD